MGEIVNGEITKITEGKTQKGTTLFFYELDGKRVSSFKKLDVKEGDSVTLPVKRNQQYINLDEDRMAEIQVTKGTVQANLPPSQNQYQDPKDAYWRAKEARDVKNDELYQKNQLKIGRQSNWNTAVAIHALLYRDGVSPVSLNEVYESVKKMAHDIETDVTRA